METRMKVNRAAPATLGLVAVIFVSVPALAQMRLRLPDGSDTDCRKAVTAIQETLAQLGYDPGGVDGHAGPRTVAAIKTFEKRFDLPVTGQISETLLAFLHGQTLSIKMEAWVGNLQGWKESFTWNADDGSRYKCSYEYVMSDNGDALYVGDASSACHKPARVLFANGLSTFPLVDQVLANRFGPCPQLWR
jgi:lysozyme family protein